MMDRTLLFSCLVLGIAASTTACGSKTLQPIDPGAGGSGGSSSTGGAGNGSGTNAFDNPVLVVVNEDGFQYCFDIHDTDLVGGCSGLPDLVEETPWALAQSGKDLIIATSEAVGQARLWRTSGFFGAPAGPLATAGELITFDPVSSSTQLLHSIRGDARGALWMLTSGVTNVGIPSNTLRVSLSGELNGPWLVYESEPAIGAWTQLADPNQIVIGFDWGMQRLVLDPDAGTFTEAPAYNARYTAIAYFDNAFYAVTDLCTSGPVCSKTGELHIWSDVSDPSRLATAPDIVAELPENNSVACGLAVMSDAVAVTTCAAGAASPEPTLLVLTEGASPQSFALDEEPLDVEVIRWDDDDVFGRSMSVFVRTASHVRIFEDPEGSAMGLVHTVGSSSVPPGQTRDMLIGD